MEEKSWKALEHCCNNTLPNQGDVTKQTSVEWIIVRDSEDITVNTTDTQAALGIQAGLQAAIAVVISISVGSSDIGNAVAQDLYQIIKTKQTNRQKTIIEKSRSVTVTTTDTDISVNIQVLHQILIAIVLKLNVL